MSEGCAEGGAARHPEELGCVIKTLIIQSITNAIIGGRAEDGRGEGGEGGRISGHTPNSIR